MLGMFHVEHSKSSECLPHVEYLERSITIYGPVGHKMLLVWTRTSLSNKTRR